VRILAAHFPGYPLQVALRACPLPEGRRAAFVVAATVADGRAREVPPSATLVATSSIARRAGIVPGMTVTQARARSADVIVRPTDPAAHEAARISIAEVLSGFGPRVEVQERLAAGFVDVTGERTPEIELAHELVRRLAPAGFVARAAAASGRFGARTLAAHARAPACAVAAEEEEAALAPLPSSMLPLEESEVEERAREVLPRLGLATLADIARLPADTLARRFGAPAARWPALARGDDPTPLAPFRLPEALFEKVELAMPLDQLEPMLFPLRALFDRLCARLIARGVACSRVVVHLVLEPWGRPAPGATLEIRLPQPTVIPRTLLEVARERLSRLRLPGPVREMAVELADSVPTRERQLELFSKAPPAPEKLAVTLGRLASAFGETAVFAAALAEEHRPERAYDPREMPEPVPMRDPAPPPPPDDRLRPVRLLHAPEPVHLRPPNGSAAAELVVRGMRLTVTSLDGPERLSGEWWESYFDRDYFLARTEEGSRWWIFHDRRAGTWHLHGLFD
jgi:protein ImuB